MTTLDNRLAELGITADIVSACPTPACNDASDLIDAGEDMFGRSQQMTEETCRAWHAMVEAAAEDGIELKLVSAYRSVAYQCEVIQRKLDEGRCIEDILTVNAIPGHSEHHSGCAIDLHAGDGPVLEESFDQTPAFAWLSARASDFDFYLSYPRNNAKGIAYEPWHWCYRS